jgi:hypothetical protein
MRMALGIVSLLSDLDNHARAYALIISVVGACIAVDGPIRAFAVISKSRAR